jgi:hypothetical protein
MSELKIADLNFCETASLDRQQLRGGGIIPDGFLKTGVDTALDTKLNTGVNIAGDIVKGFFLTIDANRGVAGSAAAALALNGKVKVKAIAKNLFS